MNMGEQVRLSDWSRRLDEEQQKNAALDAFASLAVYRTVMEAGSPVPPIGSELNGLDVYLIEECGTRRMAQWKVADLQPRRHGSFQVASQLRVWVEFTELLVPRFVKMFALRREPRKLSDMVNTAKNQGISLMLVVSRRNLRDASHPIEVPDLEEQ